MNAQKKTAQDEFRKKSTHNAVPTKRALMEGARALVHSKGKILAARYLVGHLFRGALDASGQPYAAHLQRTGDGMRNRQYRYLGYMHDLIENVKGWTLKDLAWIGFDANDLAVLDAVTKRKGEKYFDFVMRVGLNAQAIDIKLSDIADNSNFLRVPPEKLYDPKWIENKQKYHLSYRYLAAIRDGQIAPGHDFGLWLKTQPCWEDNQILLRKHKNAVALTQDPFDLRP